MQSTINNDQARRIRTFPLSSGTTLAVLLTSVTMLIGFGSLGIADHRGLQSLGIVLLLGVGLCLLISWFTLPALLSYFGPAKIDASTEDKQLESCATGREVALASDRTTSPTAVASGTTGLLLLQDIPILLSLPDYPDVR